MKYSYEDNKAQVSENCKTDDPNWLEPKAEDWFPSSLADQVFLRPSDPMKWKPEK